jgi:hypothetical protein
MLSRKSKHKIYDFLNSNLDMCEPLDTGIIFRNFMDFPNTYLNTDTGIYFHKGTAIKQ